MDQGYTVEQAEKAIREKFYKDMEKQIAIHNHERAIKWVSKLNLPYRVALDYAKRIDIDFMQIHLSEWYPLPKIPLVAMLSQEESTNKRELELKALDDCKTWFDLCTEHTGEINSDGKEIVRLTTCRDEQYLQEQAVIDEKARRKADKYKPWNLETKQGIEQWEKYFTLYIVPYESVIASWNGFNMFGDTKHSEKELNERKAYYMDLIKRYNADKVGWFDKEPRTKQLADYDLYDFYEHGIPMPMQGFYMWDRENVPNHPQALQIMQKELAMFEQANKRDYGHYRDIEKIKAIIESLEH